MITVAIASLCKHKQRTLEYIYDSSRQQGIRTLSITPSHGTLYKHNKKVKLKKYIDDLEEKLGLLIIQVTKDELKHEYYKDIKFDITLLCDTYYKRKGTNKRDYIPLKFIKKLPSNYYIIPDTYAWENTHHITYGWSKDANVSASSVQENRDGGISMQCCIQLLDEAIGQSIGPKEIYVNTQSKDVGGVLAGVATMILYDMNESRVNESRVNEVNQL